MHTGSQRFAALLAGSALALAGCSPLTPADTRGPGPFAGAGAASAASDITRGANANSGERYATGGTALTAAAATTNIIAKHQATQRQREIAIQRAQAAQRKLVARQQAAASRPTPAGKKPAAKRKLPRYLAVETVREATTAPAAKKVVMIWDTESEKIVGNNVYDISNPPPVGATTRFETYAAEYIGAGL